MAKDTTPPPQPQPSASTAATAAEPPLLDGTCLHFDDQGRARLLEPDGPGEREWLLTNGLGGYAMGTVGGHATRRYHGWLMAALAPPVNRHLLLQRVEETVDAEGRGYNLATSCFASGFARPAGAERLLSFEMRPHPSWVYDLDGERVRRTLCLVHRHDPEGDGEAQTVVAVYERLPPAGPGGAGAERTVRLFLRPVIAFREDHHTTRENGALDRTVHNIPARDGRPAHAWIQPYPRLPALFFWTDPPARLEGDGWWYRQHLYVEERARGLDHLEDLYSPGAFTVPLRPGMPVTLAASTRAPSSARSGPEILAADRRRLVALVSRPQPPAAGDRLLERLTRAADAYIVKRDVVQKGASAALPTATVIAGYPWFTDWGRDTMIALPGLTLCTGRFEEAQSILRAFAAFFDRGMLPNRFPDRGEEPHYNSVDAALWFFVAAHRYLAYSGDEAFVLGELLPRLEESVAHHDFGTRFGVAVDRRDGLLRQGQAGVQLTWMDAKIGDEVITPRRGKAVEVVALWANALGVLADLLDRAGQWPRATRYRTAFERVKESFEARFWRPDRGHYADVVGDGPDDDPDDALRPNQLLAMALPHPIARGPRAERALDAVERELLTEVGLRTLAPSDPRFCRQCAGGPESRDRAYHQGTIWPWLLGPYVTALCRLRGARGREQARLLLTRFAEQHLDDAGLGQASEIFDGEAPFAPRGCPAQAWSVAEVLRAYREDVLGLRGAAEVGRRDAAG